jgi:hypothetical protein
MDSGGSWPKLGTSIEAGGALELTSISVRLPLADVYAGTTL